MSVEQTLSVHSDVPGTPSAHVFGRGSKRGGAGARALSSAFLRQNNAAGLNGGSVLS